MQPGDRIRYKVGSLGITGGPPGYIVREGDAGFYVGPHPSPKLARDGWHITEAVLPDGDRATCPVQFTMFEAA